MLDEKFGFLGSVARLVFDLAWLLLTFFVVPVIIVEDTTDIRLILQQSGATFKQTWGESVTASLSVSLVTLPVVLVGVTCLASAYITLTGPTAWLLGSIGLLAVVTGIVASQVLGMVARVALYEYATKDHRVGPFERRDPCEIFPETS
nr:DUF6159 family protein [Halomicroarcula sp. YJ-61-S]